MLAKELFIQAIQNMPDDATGEDIVVELELLRRLNIPDSEKKFIPHSVAMERLRNTIHDAANGQNG